MRWIVPLILMSFAGPLLAAEYNLPKLPDGLEAKVVVAAPGISDPASVAASADGRKLYIGEHHSAGNSKWGGIKLAYDADGDGQYERITDFAIETNGAQGMLCVGDTVYLVHSPLLTSFRDTNGDGVADERKDLLTGIGPNFNGGLHDHTASGLALGVDGWLYISIGDWGVHQGRGTDGSEAQLYGGGIVRCRRDGSDLEVYCLGLRNTMDVGLNTELEIFMRDNTNDGGGWNVRSTHIWQSGQYGYPNLFKNYFEETLPCMADHGGGSPCGILFYAEKGLRPEDRNSFLFCDWGRAIVYQYGLKKTGATYELEQKEWLKPVGHFRGIDAQPDAAGNLYIADWGRGNWSKCDPTGAIVRINTPNSAPNAKLPNFKTLDAKKLIELFSGESHLIRLLAQQELLTRGPEIQKALLKVAEDKKAPRIARVTALWTYKQSAGADAAKALEKIAKKDAALRQHALRAITDRKAELSGAPVGILEKSLSDEDPFVRAQACISLGRLKNLKTAPALCGALGDPELQVRHLAMQALRGMEAWEECLRTVERGSDLAAQFALIATREIYQDAAADALIILSTKLDDSARRAEVVKAMGRLAIKEDVWQGNWWGTQPNTVGPYQKPAQWSSSEKLVAAVRKQLDSSDPKVLAAALWSLGCVRDTASAEVVVKYCTDTREEVRKLAWDIVLRTRSDAAAPLFGRTVADTNEMEERRKLVLDTLDQMKSAAADKAVLETVATIEAELKAKPDKKDLSNAIQKALRSIESRECVPQLKTIVQNKEYSVGTRAAAATGLTHIRSPEADAALTEILNDPNPELVALALKNVDRFGPVTPDRIKTFLANKDPQVKGAALIALGRKKHLASLDTMLQALKDDSLQTDALEALNAYGPHEVEKEALIVNAVEQVLALLEAEEQVSKAAEQSARRMIKAWLAGPTVKDEVRNKLNVRVTSLTGVIGAWQVLGPIDDAHNKRLTEVLEIEKIKPEEIAKYKLNIDGKTYEFKAQNSTDPNGIIHFPGDNRLAIAYCEIESPKDMVAKFFFGSDDGLVVYLNGQKIWTREGNRGLNVDEDKFTGHLKAGRNYILAKVANATGGFSLCGRIEGLHAGTTKRTQQREALVAETLARTGNVANGEKLFHDEKRAGCIRCHAVNNKGGSVGPNLSSIGATKDKRYLIDSMLEPSKELAQGFQPMKITLKSGKIMFGVMLDTTPDSFNLAMSDGNKEKLLESDVKEKTPVSTSVMPEGLVDTLSKEEFADLVTYLQSLKK